MNNQNHFKNSVPRLIKQASLHQQGLSNDELFSLRGRVMSRLSQCPAEPVAGLSWREKARQLFRYAVSITVGVSLVGGTAFAANISQPGDFLYPIKRVQEKAVLAVVVSDQKKAELRTQFAEERIKEFSLLNAKSSQENVTHAPQAASSSPAAVQEKQEKLRVEVKNNTAAEVKNALTELEKVKKKLEEKGNTEAVQVITRNISRLQESAEKEQIKIELPEKESQEQAEPQVKSESTVRSGSEGNTNKRDMERDEQRKRGSRD